MIPPVRIGFSGPRAVLNLVCLVGAASFSAGASADERLDSLIQNVEANEALYENLDVRLQTKYDIGERTPRKDVEGNEIGQKDVGTHFVSQDGLFRLNSTASMTDADNEQSSRENVRLFDGKQTKVLANKAIGNVIPGRAEEDGFVRPHTILLRHQSMPAPLSVYLRGHAAIASFAGGNFLEGHELEIAYKEEGEFDGLKCHKVEIKTFFLGTPDAPRTISEMWLAESRNYLPVRWLMWVPALSTELPRVQGSVSELREVKPGIWFPEKAHITSYQQGPLTVGDQDVQWQEDYRVESVSLEPQYDLAYFSDLEFPDGTAVYEVEDGKINKSYRVGAPQTAEGPPANAISRWWFLWGNLAVLALIAGAFFWRRRRALKLSATLRT